MNDIKLEFRGNAELLKAFAEHAKKHGLAVTLDELNVEEINNKLLQIFI